MEFIENGENFLQLSFEIMSEGVTEHNPRVHSYYEVIMYLEPIRQSSTVNGVRAQLTDTPALLLFAPYTVHRTLFEAASPTEYIVVRFDQRFMKALPGLCDVFPLYENNVYTNFEVADLVHLVRPLWDILRQHRGSVNYKRLLFPSLLYLLLKYTPSEIIDKKDGTVSLASQIIQYMSEHIQENLTAQSVAEHFFISYSKLNHIFTHHLSIRFHDLLNEIKLGEACRLLTQTEMSVSEVSEALGFTNDTYFFTFFKRNTGTTPYRYKKNML
jgi:AraC-like DNA-binding protein